MTRPLLITLVLSFAACASSPRHPTNLATAGVHAVEQDAKCDGGYAGEGAQLTYSTTCRLPSKALIYCAMSTISGLRCEPLGGASAQTDQQRPTTSVTTATPAPPLASERLRTPEPVPPPPIAKP